MANNHKNKKAFGVSEITRYYSGEMPPDEMHELEKAALEDPFLADALEGFAHTNLAPGDIIDLKARLIKRKHSGRIYRMLFRAAAMVILMAGSGWLLYQFAVKDQENNISYSNPPEIDKRQPAIDTFANQVTLPEKKATDQKIIKKEESSSTASTIKKRPQFQVNEDLQSFKNKDVESITVYRDSLEDAEAKANLSTTSRLFVAPLQKKAQSDSSLTSNSLLVQSRKEQNEKILISNIGNQVIITIKETPEGLNEMVLSRRIKDSLVRKMPSIIIEEAEPEESWNDYGEYLSDNIRKLEDIQFESLTGTVKLSFDVNTSGEPVNIHIDKSLCKKCDAEALRILKEGPKWKKKPKRGRVIIQF